MARTMTRCTIVATFFVACLMIADLQTAQAHDYGNHNMKCGYAAGSQDLFYNYYIGPGNCFGGIPAEMYPSPRPTPAWTGHTYVTYQPLMPHEMLYKHHRTYYRQHPDGSGVRTKVTWR